ncbi:MgtC/SapB transporter [Natronococcus pandeyae]|uniref:MgtC/SapB transporter n=1 Tax=Natronococcus pandeyae TaxID=2055836 RepID=A0A8J8PZ87_9EURY|nr:MgtC/SapB family protein [Natronococcus pandeyae]TYL36511.1 MgtC/SapB transporter [Natronococcus pandeyae]
MTDMIAVPVLLVRVFVAIATGGLIGLERERRPTRKFAGLRTLALLCGAGPIVVHVGHREGSPAFLAIYLGLAAAFALAIVYVRVTLSGSEESEVGFTTSVTVFLVALLGLLVGYGRFFESTSIAIVLVVLLAEKERLHGYVEEVSDEELQDSLKLGALVFILYPITPDDPIDPFGVLVLREVLLFAIFVLLIEFTSYVSMRQLGGSKGLAVTGLLAGGANSFATAGVLARIANQSRDTLDAASSALLLATVSMIVRNTAIAVVLAAGLLWALWQPVVVMIVLTVAIAAVLWHRGNIYEQFDLDLESPLSLTAAAKFSVAYAAILLGSVFAEMWFGNLGLYATAFAGGLVSSAAVAVSAATVFNDGTAGAEQAAGMVVLGITASLAAKIVLVELVSGRMRSKAAAPMAVVAITGLVVFVLA